MAQRYKFSIESKRLPPSLSGEPIVYETVYLLKPNDVVIPLKNYSNPYKVL